MQIDRQMTNIAINEGLAGVYAMWPQTHSGRTNSTNSANSETPQQDII